MTFNLIYSRAPLQRRLLYIYIILQHIWLVLSLSTSAFASTTSIVHLDHHHHLQQIHRHRRQKHHLHASTMLYPSSHSPALEFTHDIDNLYGLLVKRQDDEDNSWGSDSGSSESSASSDESTSSGDNGEDKIQGESSGDDDSSESSTTTDNANNNEDGSKDINNETNNNNNNNNNNSEENSSNKNNGNLQSDIKDNNSRLTDEPDGNEDKSNGGGNNANTKIINISNNGQSSFVHITHDGGSHLHQAGFGKFGKSGGSLLKSVCGILPSSATGVCNLAASFLGKATIAMKEKPSSSSQSMNPSLANMEWALVEAISQQRGGVKEFQHHLDRVSVLSDSIYTVLRVLDAFSDNMGFEAAGSVSSNSNLKSSPNDKSSKTPQRKQLKTITKASLMSSALSLICNLLPSPINSFCSMASSFMKTMSKSSVTQSRVQDSLNAAIDQAGGGQDKFKKEIDRILSHSESILAVSHVAQDFMFSWESANHDYVKKSKKSLSSLSLPKTANKGILSSSLGFVCNFLPSPFSMICHAILPFIGAFLPIKASMNKGNSLSTIISEASVIRNAFTEAVESKGGGDENFAQHLKKMDKAIHSIEKVVEVGDAFSKKIQIDTPSASPSPPSSSASSIINVNLDERNKKKKVSIKGRDSSIHSRRGLVKRKAVSKSSIMESALSSVCNVVPSPFNTLCRMVSGFFGLMHQGGMIGKRASIVNLDKKLEDAINEKAGGVDHLIREVDNIHKTVPSLIVIGNVVNDFVHRWSQNFST